MFMGEYHHNIDDKGRLIIPAKFRTELGDKFIVTRGLEKCLYVYSNQEWENIVAKIKTLPFTKKTSAYSLEHFFPVPLNANLIVLVELALPPHWLVTPIFIKNV